MKRFVIFTVLCALVFFFAAESHCRNFPEAKRKQIVVNLVNGIDSKNAGLKISAALRIFEFIQHDHLSKEDFSSAVIPLMKMLREGKTEMERIAAALSLYELEDGRGIYRLCGTSKLDDSEKVRHVAKSLYFQHHLNNETTYLIEQ